MFSCILKIKFILSDNAWIGIEAIVTIILFIGFLYQVKQSNYNQKTVELRNEMIAMFGIILYDDNGICWNFSKKNIMLFLDIFKKIKQHGNQSLIREFCLNRVSEAVDEDHTRYLENKNLKFLINKELNENYIDLLLNHFVYYSLIKQLDKIYD